MRPTQILRYLPFLLLACGGDDGSGALVAGNLNLQDVSADGELVAYLDASDTLHVVPIDGGDSVEVAANVDRARFHGKRLAAFQGVNVAGDTADTMLIWEEGGSAEEFGTLVVPRSLRSSRDGEHIYHEERIAADSGTKNLFLNGTMVVSEAFTERARFSSDSQWLVIGSNVANPGGGVLNQVESFPTSGAAKVVLAADGAANRFQITSDSRDVIIAVNENGDIADLAHIAIGGGSTEIIVDEGSDNGFMLLDDGETVIFLAPDDPQNPTTFSLERINRDGSARSELVGAGVVDVASTSSDGIVYATAMDSATELATLHFVSSSGGATTGLGSDALDEGFNSDGSAYVFFDRVTIGSGDPGELMRYSPADDAVLSLGADILRSSFVDANRLLFRSDAGDLRIADLTTGESSELDSGVDDYEKVRDGLGAATSSRVVYEKNSGLYIEDL